MNFSGTGTRRLSLTGMLPTAGMEGVESTHRIQPPPPGLEFARYVVTVMYHDNIYVFFDLSVRKKVWHSRARGAKAT